MYLEITNGRNSTYKYRDMLHNDGFSYEKNKWLITGDKEILKSLRRRYKRKGLKCYLYDESLVRSNDYRKTFFSKNKGFYMFHKRYYRCAYCGKIVKKECITVDHIIPIHLSQRKKSIRLLMKIFNIKNINEYKNLTPSCKKCNSKKGSKISTKYIYEGQTGKFGSGITIRRIAKILTFAILLSDILLILLGTNIIKF